MALGQHLPRPWRAGIDRDERVVHLPAGDMRLAHADPALARGVEPPVGIAQARAGRGFRGQRLGRAARASSR